MKVFDKDLIDELEAELLNQYLMIIWLEGVWINGLGHLKLNVKFAFGEGSKLRTIKDWLKLITDMKVYLTKINNLGSPRFEMQLHFTEEEYDDIYQEMGESCKDPRYNFLKEKFGYSISDLICILDQLATLKGDLSHLSDKEKFKTYKEILYEYISLNTLGYGIKNPSLKQRITKGRSSQGEYQKNVKAKKQIFFDLLVEQTKDSHKYKNVSEAVKNNIDEIMHRFQIFDEEWIRSKQNKSKNQIEKLNKQKLDETLSASELTKIEKEIVMLSALIQKLEDGVCKGYPFETLDNLLPYNTVSLDEILMKALSLEKSIKEQCIESSR